MIVLLRVVPAARTAALLCCDLCLFAVAGSPCAVLDVDSTTIEDSPCHGRVSGGLSHDMVLLVSVVVIRKFLSYNLMTVLYVKKNPHTL